MYLYDTSYLNVYNVSDCVKDGEAIMIRFARHGPFIRGGTAHL